MSWVRPESHNIVAAVTPSQGRLLGPTLTTRHTTSCKNGGPSPEEDTPRGEKRRDQKVTLSIVGIAYCATVGGRTVSTNPKYPSLENRYNQAVPPIHLSPSIPHPARVRFYSKLIRLSLTTILIFPDLISPKPFPIMNGLTTLVLLALSLAVVDATIHTLCFNYFLGKDKCVNGAAGQKIRCGAKAKYQSKPVPAFGAPGKPGNSAKGGNHPKNQGHHAQNQGHHSKGQGHHATGGHHKGRGGKPALERRYDTHINIMKLQSGRGICDPYDTTKVDGPQGLQLWQESLAKKMQKFANETDSAELYGGFTWDFLNGDGSNPQWGPV
ncbi:hypothetical protein H4Q26_012124 [Puccinia striiformis f. sp. tritici PST-130]|nr:hypothetical protein H4Q26_012124 [Puccinia striiformis f. sp. tritici PST-130]